MSLIFRGGKLFLSIFGLVLALTSALAASLGGRGSNKGNCNISGECSMVVDGSAEILKWCETSKATIAWSYKRKGAFLLSCDCECTSHDNVGWVVDRDSETGEEVVQKLQVGKQSTVESVRRSSGLVSDDFSAHPYCGEVDDKRLSVSVFVTLLKQPTGSDMAPYCFYPAYILIGGNGIEVKTDSPDDGYGAALIVETSGLAETSAVLKAVSDVGE